METGTETPLDMITEVLLRLSVKDLLRFRCVSKQFNSLIESPNFIKLHLSHSKTHLIFKNAQLTLLDFENQIKTFELVPPETANQSELSIIGSCNGLIALRDYAEDLFLWNPLTAKSQKLPRSNHKIRFRIPQFYRIWFTYGFGYDPNTDDYKVFEKMSDKVEIYSLKTNSWKQKNIGSDYFNYRDVKEGGVLVNNKLHWVLSRASYSRKRIIAFDLVKEEFEVVPLPKSCPRIMDVGVLGGRLCVAADSGPQTNVNIWVMKEYGDEDSWIKLSSLRSEKSPVLSDAVVPLVYSKSRDRVLVNNYGCLYWYDIGKDKSEGTIYKVWNRVWTLSESLVAPNFDEPVLGKSMKSKF